MEYAVERAGLCMKQAQLDNAEAEGQHTEHCFTTC